MTLVRIHIQNNQIYVRIFKYVTHPRVWYEVMWRTNEMPAGRIDSGMDVGAGVLNKEI